MDFPLRKVLSDSQRMYAPSVGTPNPIKMLDAKYRHPKNRLNRAQVEEAWAHRRNRTFVAFAQRKCLTSKLYVSFLCWGARSNQTLV